MLESVPLSRAEPLPLDTLDRFRYVPEPVSLRRLFLLKGFRLLLKTGTLNPKLPFQHGLGLCASKLSSTAEPSRSRGMQP